MRIIEFCIQRKLDLSVQIESKRQLLIKKIVFKKVKLDETKYIKLEMYDGNNDTREKLIFFITKKVQCIFFNLKTYFVKNIDVNIFDIKFLANLNQI